MKDVLQGLTGPQTEAVTHVEGPLLVVAGAGSGKTRVITCRVARLVEQGVPPYRILAITFTNKAAEEMKRRVAELCGARGAWVSTFHSMCARMLRQFSALLGFEHPFTIYDRSDSLTAVKGAITELGLSGERVRPAAFLAAISHAKNDMVGPDDLAAGAMNEHDRQAALVYRLYERTCRVNNALDFDDLLLRTALLLQENADFRAYWQSRFEQVLIDEYQDTNRPQYVIARELSAAHKNICATGDPDQSIYTWRGADINNILDFRKDYPTARTVKLEQNFRSTKMILQAAAGIIKHNARRIEHGLWTENEEGGRVSVVASNSDIDEADAIVAGIRANIDQFTYGQMAIFYRTHAQSRVLEESLRDAGVPYAILDAVEFYNRKEIKDVVAYLKAVVNPADAISLLRIINEPRRGIGDRTVDVVRAHAIAGGLSLMEAVAAARDVAGLPARAVKRLEEFAAMMARLRALPRSPVADVVRAVLAETGYLDTLRRSGTEEDTARAQNLEELVNAAAEFDLDYPDAALELFLERVTLVSDSDAMTSEQGKVILMTLHSAKGLEYPVVFIAGVQEGLLPHMNSLGSKVRTEEERRLRYVGITRAKKKLYLHWASERFLYGQLSSATVSRFIREIPKEALEETSDRFAHEPAWELEAAPPTTRRARPTTRVASTGSGAPAGGGERVIEYEDEFAPGGGLKAGDRVQHRAFGVGRVLSVSGTGSRTMAIIDFKGRRKHLMLEFANLQRIG